LVAEFGTDHIVKAIFGISASIFSENVGGMKLIFGEELEKNLMFLGVAIMIMRSIFTQA